MNFPFYFEFHVGCQFIFIIFELFFDFGYLFNFEYLLSRSSLPRSLEKPSPKAEIINFMFLIPMVLSDS